MEWFTAPLLLIILGLLAWLAAVFNAFFRTRAAGMTISTEVLTSPLADASKLLLEERSSTKMPDALLWRLGGMMVFMMPLLAAVVIPLAPGLAVADLPSGIVWWTALMALLWVGVYLLGWGPNSVFPMVGGYRFVAQALAYEMPLAIVIITVALIAESLQVSEIVAGQSGLIYAIWAPVAFAIYLLCASAQAFWGPFSIPMSSDLEGGVAAELSGVDRLILLSGRYLILVVAAAFAVPLFLGGHHGPFLPGWLWILIKTILMLFLLVGSRWFWPRLRIDRFEEFAWIVLIPVSLLQLFIVGTIILLIR